MHAWFLHKSFVFLRIASNNCQEKLIIEWKACAREGFDLGNKKWTWIGFLLVPLCGAKTWKLIDENHLCWFPYHVKFFIRLKRYTALAHMHIAYRPRYIIMIHTWIFLSSHFKEKEWHKRACISVCVLNVNASSKC